jgi:hypothetical protein
VDLTGQTDDDLLALRNRAFLRLARVKGPGPRKVTVYDEIRQINRELERRRPRRAGSRKLTLDASRSRSG